MDYRLVTFQCLHFRVIAQHAYNVEEPDDTSIEGLFSKPMSSHRHSKFRCGSAECETMEKREWVARVHEAVHQCKQYFSTAAERYLDAGFRYHSIVPGARATTLAMGFCEHAHQQFGIEKCSWDNDRFFEDWQSARYTIHDVENEVSIHLDGSRWTQVVAIINDTRTLISNIEGRLAQAIRGVSRIEYIQQQQQQNEDWPTIVVKPSTDRGLSGRRRDTRGLRERVSPMEVFHQSVYKVWELRMEGFWEAFHIDQER